MKRPLLTHILTLTSWCALLVSAVAAPNELVRKYCCECHDADTKKGGLNLEEILNAAVTEHSDDWERVVRRLMTRQMPPAKAPLRPLESEYAALLTPLTDALDAAAKAHPKPGRTETLRRLNRTEYQNAVRDLLALDMDANALLPADEASHGFDNVTVGMLSPTLLERYLTAAQKISRLAMGSAERVPGGSTIRLKPDLTQDGRMEGLPFGTRGGGLIPQTFARDGEYEITIRLARDRNDEVEGLQGEHEVLVLLDGQQVQSFTVKPPPAGAGHNQVDKHLQARFQAHAGPHELGVTFLKNAADLLEYKRQPYEARFNIHRHPRAGPAIYQVSVIGPFGDSKPRETPSRRRILGSPPLANAEQVLAPLLRTAWRRPVTAEDVARFMPAFHTGQNFEAGIEAALSAMLVSREFLFRVETDPPNLPPQSVTAISDVALASRLSFFLWSSIPDEPLLTLAENGTLHQPEVLAQQARRMLADPRAQSLVNNFLAQWLQLRNLDSFTPDGRLFPDFDDNLRQAMRKETELLWGEILREDRSVLELLKTDHAWLNERLAKHYGLPHVYGSHFRKVPLATDSGRGGLLRHASVLTVTSYATRTSPVLRGKWILENLLGTPPPPPPADVPALDGQVIAESLPIRERLAAHRANTACASCHEFMDPPGFALEHFDALGRWRLLEAGQPVNASGGLPDGSTFMGVDGLEKGLLARPEIFITTLAEKLLTFALGRGLEPSDGPAIREIVRATERGQTHLSALIVALVTSPPFTHRQNL